MHFPHPKKFFGILFIFLFLKPVLIKEINELLNQHRIWIVCDHSAEKYHFKTKFFAIFLHYQYLWNYSIFCFIFRANFNGKILHFSLKSSTDLLMHLRHWACQLVISWKLKLSRETIVYYAPSRRNETFSTNTEKMHKS